MLSSKLIFSLVFLGGGQRGKYLAYFRIHQMDERFRGRTYRSSNGFDIVSAAFPELEINLNSIALCGTDRVRDNAADFVVFNAEDEQCARAKLQSVIVALEDWAKNCSLISTPIIPVNISPEVRESLLMLDITEEQEEDTEGVAPIYFDEFEAPKIAL